jgi:hypothetical protein
MTKPVMVTTFVVFREDVLQEDGPADVWYVGQCLENDVAGQGRTPEAALIAVAEAVAGRRVVCAEVVAEEYVGPAPDLYWQMAGMTPPTRRVVG